MYVCVCVCVRDVYKLVHCRDDGVYFVGIILLCKYTVCTCVHVCDLLNPHQIHSLVHSQS